MDRTAETIAATFAATGRQITPERAATIARYLTEVMVYEGEDVVTQAARLASHNWHTEAAVDLRTYQAALAEQADPAFVALRLEAEAASTDRSAAYLDQDVTDLVGRAAYCRSRNVNLDRAAELEADAAKIAIRADAHRERAAALRAQAETIRTRIAQADALARIVEAA